MCVTALAASDDADPAAWLRRSCTRRHVWRRAARRRTADRWRRRQGRCAAPRALNGSMAKSSARADHFMHLLALSEAPGWQWEMQAGAWA